jgi:hypothetical protein
MFKQMSVVVALLTLADAGRAAARELTATPGNVRQQVAALQAGDTLELQPGTYQGGIKLSRLRGRADAPIIVRGHGKDTVVLGKSGTNSMDLVDCQWVVVRDLKFDGQGKEVDAIKAGQEPRGCHHITIENNMIINHGANQQIVGISTKSPCSDWIIRGNTVLGAGTGLYLGNSDGRQPFVRGIVEYNLVSNPVGYCMQIKHQKPRPANDLLPTQPSTTIIRYNVFIKGDGPSPDGNRPNLLVGGFPETGPGSEDRYQIYGNVLFHNPRESLFQGTGRISVHDNVFIDVPGTAITVTKHDGLVPRQVFVYHNTFLGVGRAWSISGGPKELVTAANLSLADQGAANLWPAGNVRLTAAEAAQSVLDPSPQLGKADVQPRQPIAAVIEANALRLIEQDADHDRDFWGRARERLQQAGACQTALQPRPIKAEIRVLAPAAGGGQQTAAK